MPYNFIITGDWHIRGINPRARKDNYLEAMFAKIQEVFVLAEKHSALGIIVPGDITDSPGTSLGTIAELAALLQQAPCPILAIHGNHDIWGANPGTKFRTPFGLLSRLGLIHDLSVAPFAQCFTGYGFDVETDIEMMQFSQPIQISEQGEIGIHVVHSMLLEKSPGFDMRHTVIDQVITNAQVIISGHDHLGFGIHRRNDGVLFINPGALCRLSAHPAEIERSVQVALLSLKAKLADAQLIPLKCAQPGHMVLSRDHIEVEAERGDRIQRFLGLLAAGGEMQFLEVREIIERIAQQDELPQAVVKDALARIGRAREVLGVVG